MADQRFHKKPSAFKLSEIAAIAGAELSNPEDADYLIEDVATLDSGRPHSISFLDNPKYRDAFHATKAGACIIHPDLIKLAPPGIRLVLSKSPYKAYALAAQALYPDTPPSQSVSANSKVHPTATVAPDCVIEDFAVIGPNVEIGSGCWIESHAVINAGCQIGKNCRVGAHSVLSYALIGDNVRIYAGVKIGQDGFGFAIDPAGYVKVPQLGRVIIEGNSEIGANTTIDRGALNDTVIGFGSWLDNQIQVGHNVKIGKGCILAAQVGISGSTEIGDYVAIGGQAGIAGHLKIGKMARIAAKSGVTRDIPEKAEWMGYPAMPMKQNLRHVALLNKMSKKSHEVDK
jgi:UDP-3-O-[3-hydroxymyristoyl] glucosamine N-acyltransferase